MDLEISGHAILRYQERVKPTLDIGQCKQELGALADAGKRVTELPYERYGHGAPTDGPKADSYIELAPCIWGVVVKSRLVTCLTETSVSPARRTRRNETKAAYRQSKQRKRKDYFFKAGSRRTRMTREQ